MKNVYHRDIVEILLESGRNGQKLGRISKKIYNRHADLFATDINYDALYGSIRSYLWKQSKRRESLFTRNNHGVYALKTDAAIQLDLFWDSKPAPEETEDIPQETEEKPTNHIQMELF